MLRPGLRMKEKPTPQTTNQPKKQPHVRSGRLQGSLLWDSGQRISKILCVLGMNLQSMDVHIMSDHSSVPSMDCKVPIVSYMYSKLMLLT